MSLSIKAVDRLFTRLNATYGADFLGRYKGTPETDLKAVWAHELAGFDNQLYALGWALENLPERAPNVIEFRNLARKAPAQDVPLLPEPKADPARVAAELAKLSPVRQAASAAASGVVAVDHKAWAKSLIARHDAGERLNMTTLRFAREALGIPDPVRQHDAHDFDEVAA